MEAPMSDLDEIVEAIGDGAWDGRLEEIVAAVVARVRAGAVEMMWRIRLDGDEWTQQSVTLGELKFAESHCWVDGVDERGRPWRRRATRIEIDPRVKAEHTLALVVAHLHKAQGVPLGEATKRAEAITAADLDRIVGEYEVVHAPLGDSPPSTSS